MTEILRSRRKVLVLAPSLKAIGGVQNYTRTLLDALREVLGNDRVRLVAVSEDAAPRHNAPPALRASAKIRFLFSALATAISWRPDLIICAHVGVAPVGRLIRRFTGISYWVVLYGIEVWGDLPSRSATRFATRRALLPSLGLRSMPQSRAKV